MGIEYFLIFNLYLFVFKNFMTQQIIIIYHIFHNLKKNHNNNTMIKNKIKYLEKDIIFEKFFSESML